MSESEVSIRRAPKVGVFLILGAVLGALVTLILTSLFPADPLVGFLASYAYFCLFGIPAGLLLGGCSADGTTPSSRRTPNASASGATST